MKLCGGCFDLANLPFRLYLGSQLAVGKSGLEAKEDNLGRQGKQRAKNKMQSVEGSQSNTGTRAGRELVMMALTHCGLSSNLLFQNSEHRLAD